ncbi:hypothetical protein D3C71_1965640 [compost metagenome]
MKLGEAEQLQRQRVAVAIDARDIAAAHEPVEHPVEFVRAAIEPLRYLRLRQTAIDACQQFEDIKSLVQRGGAVAIGLFGVHGRPP